MAAMSAEETAIAEITEVISQMNSGVVDAVSSNDVEVLDRAVPSGLHPRGDGALRSEEARDETAHARRVAMGRHDRPLRRALRGAPRR